MKHIKFVSLMLIAFVFFEGCSGDYGIIRRQPPTDNKMTLAQLRENWKDYHIYQNSGDLPRRIMFDPKNDETRLVGGTWIKIEDQQTLSETIRTIQITFNAGEVMIIEGPDGRLFGYMYFSWNHPWTYGNPSEIAVKRVDEHTLYVVQ